MGSFRRILFPISIVLSACAERILPPPGTDAEFALATPDVWAGDTIVVRSAWFTELTTAAETILTVVLGDDTLAAWYAGGDSVAAQAPATAGTAALVLWSPGGPAHLGSVRVYGYDGEQQGPPVFGVLQPWPAGGSTPSLLAFGVEGMVRVDLRYGTASLLVPYDSASPMGCNWGPGPTHRSGTVVMCRRAWTIGATATPAESVPWPSSRLTAVLAGGARVDLFHHEVSVRDASGGHLSLGTEEPDEVRISPRGDRVAIKTWTNFYPWISGQQPPPGYPVWDSLGTLAFFVGRLEPFATIPAFSLTGDTLFAASHRWRDADFPDTLFVIDANDGAVLERVALPGDLWPTAVAPDPDGDRVFVYGWRQQDGALAVVDLRRPGVDAYIPAPWFAGENPELVFDRGLGRLYVAFGDNFGTFAPQPEDVGPLKSIRFTLRPQPAVAATLSVR